MHIHEPTRRSPAPHAHPRAHKGIARLARTCARPQGNPQTRAHMRKTTRKSTDSRAHPRAHKESRSPRAHPRAHARIPGQARRTAVRVAPLLTSLTSTTTPPCTDTPARAHSPVSAERSHGLVNWRGEKKTRNGTAAGRREENTKSRIRRSGLNGGRYWDRTSDLFRVKEARYPCANRPRWVRDSNPCIRLCRPLPRLSANPPRPMGSCGFPIESG